MKFAGPHAAQKRQGTADSCPGMPAADVYLGLMMNEDLMTEPDSTSKAPEVGFMDELLAD